MDIILFYIYTSPHTSWQKHFRLKEVSQKWNSIYQFYVGLIKKEERETRKGLRVAKFQARMSTQTQGHETSLAQGTTVNQVLVALKGQLGLPDDLKRVTVIGATSHRSYALESLAPEKEELVLRIDPVNR